MDGQDRGFVCSVNSFIELTELNVMVGKDATCDLDQSIYERRSHGIWVVPKAANQNGCTSESGKAGQSRIKRVSI